jgi:hypothetical protein
MVYVAARGFAAALLVTALFHSPTAAAQESPMPPSGGEATAEQVQKLNDEGTALYHARDYRRANEKFQQAYALGRDPNILYNIAKTYEALGDDAAALEKYEAFVREPSADPQGRSKAEQTIINIRARVSAKKAPPARKAPPAPERRLVVPTVIAAGIGVAGIGVGTFFGLRALDTQSDLDTVCASRQCPPTAKDDVTSLKTSSTVSTIGFIAGGVGIATAVALFIAGRPGAQAATTGAVRVVPTAGPAGLGVLGVF